MPPQITQRRDQQTGTRSAPTDADQPGLSSSRQHTSSVTYSSQTPMYDIQNYLTTDGRDPYAQWLSALADRQARARILVRVARMGAGNLGDCKPLSDGVWELRIDWGPGYRVYYAMAGKRLVLLLVGGDKRKQQADINTALDYWNDWQQRRRKAT